MEAAFLLWASCTFRSFSLAGAASLSQPIVLVVRVLTLYFFLTFALWSPLRTSFIYVVLNIMPISMCNLSLNLFWLWFPISYYKLHIHLGHLTSSLNSTGLKSISCLLAVRLLLSVKGRQIEGVCPRTDTERFIWNLPLVSFPVWTSHQICSNLPLKYLSYLCLLFHCWHYNFSHPFLTGLPVLAPDTNTSWLFDLLKPPVWSCPGPSHCFPGKNRNYALN